MKASNATLGIVAAAAGLWALLRKKKGAAGIGSIGIRYIVLFIPKDYWQEGMWLKYPYVGLQNNRDSATRFDSRKEAEKCAQEIFEDYLKYDYKGFEVIEIKDHDEERVAQAIDTVLSYEDKTRYALLDRMRADCDYYLGNGRRNARYLWMRMDEQGHIDVMRALWDSFVEKPEWLTREKIDWYAEQMGVE